jgi:hypothetical protein
MSDDEVKLLADAKNLPIVERVSHSNWKARNTAYEDMKVACQRVFSDSDPCLYEYGELLKSKYIAKYFVGELSCHIPSELRRAFLKGCWGFQCCRPR